jgi:hypothetical protein
MEIPDPPVRGCIMSDQELFEILTDLANEVQDWDAELSE